MEENLRYLFKDTELILTLLLGFIKHLVCFFSALSAFSALK